MISRLYLWGYWAAVQGQDRQWAEERGEECLAGYDAYWDQIEEMMAS